MDGDEWTSHRVPELDGLNLDGVFWEGGTLIGVDSGYLAGGWTQKTPGESARAKVVFSPDGIVWTATILGPGGVYTVGEMEGLLVAGGCLLDDDFFCPATIWISPDGSNWTQRKVDSRNLQEGGITEVRSLERFGTGLIAMGNGGETWFSTEGDTWRPGPLLSSATGWRTQLVTLEDTLILVGERGQVWTSDDGLDWERTIFGTGAASRLGFDHSTCIRGVRSTGSELVAWGALRQNGSCFTSDLYTVWRSADGLVWDEEDIPAGINTVQPFDRGLLAARTVNTDYGVLDITLDAIDHPVHSEIWIWTP